MAHPDHRLLCGGLLHRHPLKPEDIHIMKKSSYSGAFGDYSSYSSEFDEIGDPEADGAEVSADEE